MPLSALLQACIRFCPYTTLFLTSIVKEFVWESTYELPQACIRFRPFTNPSDRNWTGGKVGSKQCVWVGSPWKGRFFPSRSSFQPGWVPFRTRGGPGSRMHGDANSTIAMDAST
eukprot:scaffold682_cov363-Pavlova_lutheri.AAC.61